MMATSSVALSVVEDWQAELRDRYQAIDRHYEKASADHDQARAELLAEYYRQGKTQREIAACLIAVNGSPIGQKHVDRLLRYQRCVSPIGLKITESRFRQYWQQLAPDLRPFRHDPERKAAEEARVFALIEGLVNAGTAPAKPAKAVKEAAPAAATPAPLSRKTLSRKEVQELNRLSQTMFADLREFRRLTKHVSRVWAPTVIASHSDRYFRCLRVLHRALKDAGIPVPPVDWEALDADMQ